jgi:hypothetical protein
VKWDNTLIPRSALKNAEKLIAKFMARCLKDSELKTLSAGSRSVQVGLARVGNDTSGKT